MNVAFVSQPWDKTRPAVLAQSIAIWTYEVAKRLAAESDVTVYARKASAALEFTDENIRYRHISVRLDDKMRSVCLRLPFFKTPPFDRRSFYIGYITKIALDLRRRDCDVVHIHNFSQFVPTIRRFNRRARIVLHMHCEWLTQLKRETISRRLKDVDMVLGCSNYIIEKVRKAFPEHAHKCHALFNGVDVDRFKDNLLPGGNSAPTIMTIGRVSPEKGLHVLLDAFRKILNVIPQARLQIVGPDGGDARPFIVGVSDDPVVRELASICNGSYRDHLEGLLDGNLREKVSFAGSVPHDTVPELLGGATILAHPSFTEAFGMPVAEAMAAGVPVVASAVGGVAEIVENGQTGFLVERNDSDALAEAMLKLLKDQSLRRNMGIESRKQAAAKFSWQAITERLMQLYRSVN